MKTFLRTAGRTLVLLAAAMLVVGGLVLLSRGSSNEGASLGGELDQQRFSPPAGEAGDFPSRPADGFEGRRRGRDGMDGSLPLLGGLVRNGLVIGLVILVTLGIGGLVTWMAGPFKKKAGAPAKPSSS